MQQTQLVRALMVALATTLSTAALADNSTDVAPKDGWASQTTGTSGGSAATAANTFRVTNATEFKAAVKAGAGNPTLIKVVGTIDFAASDNGGAFISTADQTTRGTLKLKSNTTVIGVGSSAGFRNVNLIVPAGVDNVIIRNLTFSNPCDVAPVWDPTDGSTGNWNSQFDSITVNGGTHVWIDHNKFTDAPKTDDQSPIENGKLKQCHDGAVDIKSGADYLTLSYNIFELHDKNDLVGSSDSSTVDEGKLSVTFHHNLFSNVMERAPRVRFGKVHLYNNYYVGSTTHPVYPVQYQIGVGYNAKIISNNNNFEIAGATLCSEVIKNPGSATKPGAILDSGSTLNGKALNVTSTCGQSDVVTWVPPYSFNMQATNAAKTTVINNAGPGKLTVN